MYERKVYTGDQQTITKIIELSIAELMWCYVLKIIKWYFSLNLLTFILDCLSTSLIQLQYESIFYNAASKNEITVTVSCFSSKTFHTLLYNNPFTYIKCQNYLNKNFAVARYISSELCMYKKVAIVTTSITCWFSTTYRSPLTKNNNTRIIQITIWEIYDLS